MLYEIRYTQARTELNSKFDQFLDYLFCQTIHRNHFRGERLSLKYSTAIGIHFKFNNIIFQKNSVSDFYGSCI